MKVQQKLSRRAVLKDGLGAGLALTTLGLSPQTSAGPINNILSDLFGGALGDNFRIDVHCHHIPDFYRASLAENGITTAGGIPLPSWSPLEAVHFMNTHGIQVQVVSISEPGVYYLPSPDQRKQMAIRINDYTTEQLMNSEHPVRKGRFGGFGVLPLRDTDNTVDVNNACREAERIVHHLRMDGVGLFSSYNGVYLGDEKLDPLMETLDELGAMVFVHPVTPDNIPDLGLPTFLFEFPFDTTRAVVNMRYKRIFERFPKIRWLLAHAGGATPFIAERADSLHLYPQTEAAGSVDLPNDQGAYANLFYDTALSPDASAMGAVAETAPVSNIMFATDWPFAGPVFLLPGDPAPRLKDTFTDLQLKQVLRNNALEQFPTIRERILS